jgi:transcription elongation factor GreA
MSKVLLTKEGFQQLTEELKILKEKQTRLIDQIEEGAQPDESGEDSLAHQLKEELEVVDNKIDELTQVLTTSKVISRKSNCSSVEIGCQVTVKVNKKTNKEFFIVSHFESDPHVSKISDQSPIGQALIGKKVDDEFEVDAPAGKMTYKIVSIS